METQKPLLKDKDGEEVDVYMYRLMIGSLMYLTSSRLDIMFAVCACARYQVNPKVSHLHAVKRVFSSKTIAWNKFSSTMASAIICLATNQKFNFSKYIFEIMVRNLDNVSGKFLMYPRFVQVFLNQQLGDLSTHNRIYVAPSHTKKIFANMRRVGKVFSGRVTPLFPTMVVPNQAELGEGLAIPTDPHHTPTFIQSSPQPQKTQKPRKPKRKDTQVPQPSDPSDNVADEAVHKELGDSLVRAATTASSLEAEHDSGNITKTRSKATPNESSSLGTTSGGGSRCQETMGDTIAQTRFENVSKLSNDSLLTREDKDQANKIASLKRRVKTLEKKRSSRTHKLKRLYKVGLSARVESYGNEEDLDDADNEMFDVGTVTGDEVFAEQEVATKDVNLTIDEVTLAQELAALKSVKSKVKGDVIEDPSVPVSAASASTKVSAATTTTATIPTPRKGIIITELGTPTITRSSQQLSQAKVEDKGKEKMIEPEKPLKKKDLIRLDEEIASKLQAKFDKEERIAREKDEANIALTEEWDDIQAKIEADHELDQRLQAEEQEELSDAKKATLFQQLLEKRRKHFAAKRAEEQRNKPPTQAQQRKIMCTYLKNVEGMKLKDLKNKSFDSIQKMFNRSFNRVNTFVDFRADLVECSSKRAGEELIQESSKKQNADVDKDT
ncbi:hypothetical protein Tco_0652999 [Tanacetum coccineum]|uniref:Uncharacterized protein n=1 Tax=Tanacetum coccineum TaxID=301880 RepID=A0ABQ4WZB5_9ASTR